MTSRAVARGARGSGAYTKLCEYPGLSRLSRPFHTDQIFPELKDGPGMQTML